MVGEVKPCSDGRTMTVGAVGEVGGLCDSPGVGGRQTCSVVSLGACQMRMRRNLG